MRKLMLVAAAAVALATAGLAVARGLDSSKNVKSVAGTFTATTVANSQTRSCTTTDGKTIASTNATYAGTASGDADLAGPITLNARSIVNTTDDVGVVEGKLKIAASGGDTVAHFAGVYDHGKLAGLAEGHAKAPNVQLVGNVSAGFSATGGFTDGKIGGSAGGSAVELGPGKCSPAKAASEKSEAEGTVSAVSATSITVSGLTCAIPASLSAMVNSLVKLGDRAEIKCSLSNGVNTLVKINAKTAKKK